MEDPGRAAGSLSRVVLAEAEVSSSSSSSSNNNSSIFSSLIGSHTSSDNSRWYSNRGFRVHLRCSALTARCMQCMISLSRLMQIFLRQFSRVLDLGESLLLFCGITVQEAQ